MAPMPNGNVCKTLMMKMIFVIVSPDFVLD